MPARGRYVAPFCCVKYIYSPIVDPLSDFGLWVYIYKLISLFQNAVTLDYNTGGVLETQRIGREERLTFQLALHDINKNTVGIIDREANRRADCCRFDTKLIHESKHAQLNHFRIAEHGNISLSGTLRTIQQKSESTQQYQTNAAVMVLPRDKAVPFSACPHFIAVKVTGEDLVLLRIALRTVRGRAVVLVLHRGSAVPFRACSHFRAVIITRVATSSNGDLHSG